MSNQENNYNVDPLLSPAINNHALLNRFNSVINDIVKQLYNNKMDLIIARIKRSLNNPDEFDNIVDSLILNCNYINANQTYKCFDQYVDMLLATFTRNEEYCLLGHMNLSNAEYEAAEISSLLHYSLYNIIKQKLINTD